jgi:hypothetical protein
MKIDKEPRKKDLAKTHDHLIRRLLASDKKYQFSFTSKGKAISYLDHFRSNFIISSQKEDEEFKEDEVTLWVKHYKHSFTEKRSSIAKGEFIRIFIVEDETPNVFRYDYEVLNIDPKYHPQRGVTLQAHPNWGFPILREFKRKKAYKDKVDIWRNFERISDYFPSAAIRPEQDKLFCKVFEDRERKGAFPYIFEIVENESGEFIVDIKENNFKRIYSVGQRVYFFGT